MEAQRWLLRSEEEDFRTTTRRRKSLWTQRAEGRLNVEARSIVNLHLLHLRLFVYIRIGHEFGGALFTG